MRLGGVEGTFTLPDPLPDRLLFISAGSGITPIMSMLRDLDRRERAATTSSTCTPRARPDDVIFGDAAARARRSATPASACTSS